MSETLSWLKQIPLRAAAAIILAGGLVMAPSAEANDDLLRDTQELLQTDLQSNSEGFLTIDRAAPRGGWEYGPALITTDDGKQHMFFCATAEGVNPNNIDRIVHTTSDDGKTWSKPTTALAPGSQKYGTLTNGRTSVCDPSVIKFGDSWLMYNTCLSLRDATYHNNKTCVATAPSIDGPWIEQQPVYEDRSCPDYDGPDIDDLPDNYCIGQPSALVINGLVRLYVTDRRLNQKFPSPGSLLMMESADGKKFGKPRRVFGHSNAAVAHEFITDRYFMTFGDVDSSEIYWNVSNDGVNWLPFDPSRTINTPTYPWKHNATNHNPGIMTDETGSFILKTIVGYGGAVGPEYGQWNIHTSSVTLNPTRNSALKIQ